MMDPERLSEGADDTSSEEAALLRSAQGVRMAESERKAVWSGIATQLGLPAAYSTSPSGTGVTGGGGSGAATTTGVAAVGKGVLLVAVVLGLGAGGYAITQNGRVSLKSNAPIANSRLALQPLPAAVPAPSGSSAKAESAPAVVAEAASPIPPAVTAPSAELRHAGTLPSLTASAPPLPPASLLREESSALTAARQALQAGAFSVALKALEETRERFPHGALGQEREALTVEALAKSGSRAAAERRARAFLRSYPKSPYAADVERYAGH
jgi:hypothetical protein